MSSYTLAQLQEIAGSIQKDAKIFLTSANWGRLAAELDPETLTDKGNKPTPSNFKRLNVRAKYILTAINSGSEDEVALDALNRIEEENSHFLGARERFAKPKGLVRPGAMTFEDEPTELDPKLVDEWTRKELLMRERGKTMLRG